MLRDGCVEDSGAFLLRFLAGLDISAVLNI